MDLKSAFQDELNYLHQLAAERSQQNPALEAFLQDSGNDADIEFLFEHFAFLMAKLRLRVEDAVPEITQNLLSRVWPTPLRPIPSTAIVQFESNTTQIRALAKGSYLEALPPEGEACRYQLARELTVLPFRVSSCVLSNTPLNGTLTLKIQWLGNINRQNEWQTSPFQLFLSTDPQLAGLLHLWLQQYRTNISVLIDGRELSVSEQVVTTFTPELNNLVLPLDIPLFWRLQLWQEYFHLPHVNNFITVNLADEIPNIKLDEEQSFELIFQFNQPLLTEKTVDEHTVFKVNCVPVINLYHPSPQLNEFVPGQSTYQYDSLNHDPVYQIMSLYSDQSTEGNDDGRGDGPVYLPVTQFATNSFESEQIYYQSMLAHDVQGRVQLHNTFIDSQGERVDTFAYPSFWLDALLTSGQRCNGLTLGDICQPTMAISSDLLFSNITPPTQEIAAIVDSHQHWPIISHLSLSPSFLKKREVLQQLMMDLHFHRHGDSQQHALSERRLNAIVSLETAPQNWIVQGGLVKRGTAMKLTLDPAGFDDEGEMYQFGFILAHVLPFCMVSSNFLMMRIVNQQTGQLWTLTPVWGSRESL